MNALDSVMGEMPPVISIAGPTASGKSAFAVALAKEVDGEIINADALQVYADLQILSARPSKQEQEGVPHHLFGHITGDVAYSTGQWIRDAVPVTLDIMARGKTPILVGGTGLYFKALFDGLADIPEIDPSIRRKVDQMTTQALREEAESVDPDAAGRVLGNDPQRLGRIVSVYRATGQPLSRWRAETHPIIPARFSRRAVLLPDRETLYDRINQRFDAMVEQGALDEAEAVKARSYDATLPMVKAIGLANLLRYFEGELSLPDAIELAKRDSRRLAKRQMTWFRNQMAEWTILRSAEDQARFRRTLS